MSKANRKIKLTMHTLMYHGIRRVQIKCKAHGKSQNIVTLESGNVLVLACGCKITVPS